MVAEDGEDYPQAAVEETVELNPEGSAVSECIAKTIFAVGGDKLRAAMTGIHLNVDNNTATFTATNANMLSTFNLAVSQDKKASCIIPAAGLGILQGLSLKNSLKISIGEKNAVFEIDDDTKMICRLIGENFPDYLAIIPVENNNVLSLNRVEFLSAISRVSIFSNDITALIRLDLGSETKVTGWDDDFKRQADEALDADYSGEELSIGLSSKYMIQALSRLKSDTVNMFFSTPNMAVLIRENMSKKKSDLILIMPMMLNTTIKS